jgi:hypothetical protein
LRSFPAAVAWQLETAQIESSGSLSTHKLAMQRSGCKL